MSTSANPSSQDPVLVTGASGYIASWIVNDLIERGHTVHGTVRDPAKTSSVAHLLKLAEKGPGTLRLFKADLLEDGSFDAAADGCSVVMHTASPFMLEGFKDPMAELVRPAVEGTRNVLGSANRTASVQRVVLTSSVVSIFGDNIDLAKTTNGVFTEADWNATSSLDHNPYSYSKVAAEREAWAIAKAQSRWNMVAINPGFVLGPALTTNSKSASITTLTQFGDGTFRTGVPKMSFGVVDVRDVAQAHVLAAFKAEAEGRYIVTNTELTLFQIGGILRGHFGKAYPFPAMEIPKALAWLVGPLLGPVTRKYISKNVGWPIHFDNSRSLNELGVHYHPVEQTIIEHFQQLLDDGMIKKR